MSNAFPRAFAVWFRDLGRWDVKFYLSRIECRFPMVALRHLVSERSDRVNLFDFPDQTFRILGVNNTDGIFHAYDTKGDKINQPYKQVQSGDFFYNPYRVNVGSIGIVPAELGSNYASPAYVVFSADETKVLPKILELILRANWYNPTLRAATAGSVRQNLTFDLLQNLEIPLPPIETQRAILAEWRKAQDEIEAAQDKIKTIEAEIEERFFTDLGLKTPAKVKPPKCFVARWRDFLRWSVSYHQAALAGTDISKGQFPVVKLGSILELVQYGTSEKANNKGVGIPVLRINNIKNRVLDLSDLKHIDLSEKTRSGLLLKDGDILIIRTSGSRDLVGTCAVFRESVPFVFASYLIRLCVDPDKANPDFVSWFLNSNLGRTQIDAISRQIMQNNINSQELRTLKIPLPPVDVQLRIMEKVEVGCVQIAREREVVRETARRIEADLEVWMLGTKKI